MLWVWSLGLTATRGGRLVGPYVTQEPWEGVFCPMPSLPSSASDAVGPQSHSLDAGSTVSDSSMNVQILMGGRRKHF